MSYDANSNDAMFSRIIAKLEEQDRAAASSRTELIGVLREVRDEVKKTNGRVTSLEKWRTVVNAKVTTIAAAVSVAASLAAWIVERFTRH